MIHIPNNIDFEEYARQVATHESSFIHRPSYWIDQLADEMTSGDEVHGDRLPWTKTHDLVRLRPGEISIWAGFNGHMKSMLTGQVMLHLTRYGVVTIGSLEMKPEQTLMRMMRQACGTHMPSDDYAGNYLRWLEDKMAIYDQLDSVAPARILGFVYYSAKVLGANHILIDSLTKCGIGQGDGEAEKKFIDRLQWAAKAMGTHIHLVCHVRKPQHSGEEYVPNKFDIRGAGELTDLVDNVFIVWKNKAKFAVIEKRDSGGSLTEKEEKMLDFPDMKLVVEKQRHGNWEGTVGLWFSGKGLQFTASPGKAIPFIYRDLHDGTFREG